MSVSLGKFITLEGGEGSGKTTCLEYLQRLLQEHHVDVVVTREPGGTKMAELIRDLLLDTKSEPIAEETELLLMFASRAQHVNNVIKPALVRGAWVLCSRFSDSSYAYQGGGRGLDVTKIQALEEIVQGDLSPDLTFLIDVPVEVGIQRARARAALDRIEQEKMDFFQRVRQTYLDMAKGNKRFVVVDGTKPLNDVCDILKQVILAMLISYEK